MGTHVLTRPLCLVFPCTESLFGVKLFDSRGPRTLLLFGGTYLPCLPLNEQTSSRPSNSDPMAFRFSVKHHLAVGQNPWYHFGVGAPPILVYLSGDWNVHWGYGILTHGHLTDGPQFVPSRLCAIASCFLSFRASDCVEVW